MRQTVKFQLAKRLLKQENIRYQYDTQGELYVHLEGLGWIWKSKNQQWERGSTSMFKDENGVASGVIRLRVMAHPDDVDTAVKLLKKVKGLAVFEVSEEYANRKGPGTRIYMSATLDRVTK